MVTRFNTYMKTASKRAILSTKNVHMVHGMCENGSGICETETGRCHTFHKMHENGIGICETEKGHGARRHLRSPSSASALRSPSAVCPPLRSPRLAYAVRGAAVCKGAPHTLNSPPQTFRPHPKPSPPTLLSHLQTLKTIPIPQSQTLKQAPLRGESSHRLQVSKTRRIHTWCHANAMACRVLKHCMVLRQSYAMPGTDIRYGAKAPGDQEEEEEEERERGGGEVRRTTADTHVRWHEQH
eukprot:2845701-Rhodomonas_salina.2